MVNSISREISTNPARWLASPLKVAFRMPIMRHTVYSATLIPQRRRFVRFGLSLSRWHKPPKCLYCKGISTLKSNYESIQHQLLYRTKQPLVSTTHLSGPVTFRGAREAPYGLLRAPSDRRCGYTRCWGTAPIPPAGCSVTRMTQGGGTTGDIGPAGVVKPHVRLSWGGTLGTPAVEVWSNSINFQVQVAPSPDELQAAAEAAGPVIAAWISDGNSKIAQTVALTWVKAVFVKGDGKQRDVNTALYELPAPAVGGMFNPLPIWAQTYAITLRTDKQRGVGHAGRIFPPISGPGPETGNSPYAPAAAIQTMTEKFATMLDTLVSTLGDAIPSVAGAILPAIVSRVTGTNPTPLLTPITSIVMDRVADIQHRRTNRVPRNEVTGVTMQY